MPSLPLLLLTDSRFPAGGYAHSGGLEAAVEDGLAVDGIAGFLAGRLRGVSAPETHLAVVAGRAAKDADLRLLLTLDAEAAARCPSPPLRAAATRLGAQLLRTAVSVWPSESLIEQYREQSASTPRPVAFGLVAAVAGLDPYETACAYLYEEAAAVTMAAVRLLPLDSAAAARLLVNVAPELERISHEAAASPRDARHLPGGFAPALELGSLAHATRQGRLFAS